MNTAKTSAPIADEIARPTRPPDFLNKTAVWFWNLLATARALSHFSKSDPIWCRRIRASLTSFVHGMTMGEDDPAQEYYEQLCAPNPYAISKMVERCSATRARRVRRRSRKTRIALCLRDTYEGRCPEQRARAGSSGVTSPRALAR